MVTNVLNLGHGSNIQGINRGGECTGFSMDYACNMYGIMKAYASTMMEYPWNTLGMRLR